MFYSVLTHRDFDNERLTNLAFWYLIPLTIIFQVQLLLNVHGFPVWLFELLIFLMQEFGYDRGNHNVRLLKELAWINKHFILIL